MPSTRALREGLEHYERECGARSRSIITVCSVSSALEGWLAVYLEQYLSRNMAIFAIIIWLCFLAIWMWAVYATYTIFCSDFPSFNKWHKAWWGLLALILFFVFANVVGTKMGGRFLLAGSLMFIALSMTAAYALLLVFGWVVKHVQELLVQLGNMRSPAPAPSDWC